jgi:hypothetical protein
MSTIFDQVNSVEDLQLHWRDPYLQWWAAGMPSFDQQSKDPWKQISIKFRTKEDRKLFGELLNYKLTDKTAVVWYPSKDRDPNSKSRYVEEGYNQDSYEESDETDD